MSESAVYARVAEVGFDLSKYERVRVERCNLCDATHFCTLTWTDRYGFDVPLNLCLSCGLGFLSPRLTEEAYGYFYAEYYRPLVSAYHGRRIDAVTVQDDQRIYSAQILKFLEPHLRGERIERLLDIGGSTGVVASAVSEVLGCEGVVLDPSPDELEQAGARGLKTIHGTMESFQPDAASQSQLALLCQTVDHLVDIRGSLQSLRASVADDGWFYVDFVDFRAIALREGRVSSAVKVDHPYYLTRPTMEAYLALTGWDVAAMAVLPDGHHVGYLCRKGQPRSLEQVTLTQPEWLLRELRSLQACGRA